MAPPLSRIINTDWPALAATLGVPIALAIGWAHPLFFPSTDSRYWLLIHIGVPASLACTILLLWRVIRVRNLFRGGRRLVAHITQVQLAKDRGRVDFEYQLEGKVVSSWQPVHQTNRVRSLAPGQQVTALVSSTRPKTAIVKDLFE